MGRKKTAKRYNTIAEDLSKIIQDGGDDILKTSPKDFRDAIESMNDNIIGDIENKQESVPLSNLDKDGCINGSRSGNSKNRKKRRKKEQKKRRKEKKKAQIRIQWCIHDTLSDRESDSEGGGNVRSPLICNSKNEDAKLEGDSSSSSSCTVLVGNRDKSQHDTHNSSKKVFDSDFHNYANITFSKMSRRKRNHLQSYQKRIRQFSTSNRRSSDCYNTFLWSPKQKYAQFSWLNSVCWVGKKFTNGAVAISSKSSETSKVAIQEIDIRALDIDQKCQKCRCKNSENETSEVTTSINNRKRRREYPEEFGCCIQCENERMLIDGESIFPLSDEINALSLQLYQIKKRLWPAAESCAVESMKGMKGNACFREGVEDKSITTYKSSVVDHVSEKIPKEFFDEARRACNPFEVLGEGRHGGLNSCFMNRSAMKLANIDALLGYTFLTIDKLPVGNSNDYDSKNIINQRMTSLKFLDLCGAPGGFTEYLLYRCNELGINAQGWGMSLLGSNEDGPGLPWKLDHMQELDGIHFRVSEGLDGTGDIYNWENVEALQKEIWRDCNKDHVYYGREEELCSCQYSSKLNNYCGDKDFTPTHNFEGCYRCSKLVDLVAADGGCFAQRDSHEQEELTSRLLISEIAAGLSVLKPAGKLIVKMFGFRTKAMRMVMKELWQSFEKVVVVKPVLSRPASAERYLVCYGYAGVQCPNWNGLEWRDRMLSYCASAPDENSSVNDMEDDILMLDASFDDDNNYNESLKDFFHYLNLIDRNMLELNVKACFGIMTYLETLNHDGTLSLPKRYALFPKKQSVDIDLYRKAFRIDRK